MASTVVPRSDEPKLGGATAIRAAAEPVPLERLEETVAALAGLAGTRIMAALGSDITIQYRGQTRGSLQPTDPVTNVDHEVEATLSAELAALFPGHGIVGESGAANVFSEESRYTWLIDPIEGSENFIHGVPLFGSCIAVLDEGVPVAGAIWASTSHTLRPGVYHASQGGTVQFDGEPLTDASIANGHRGLIDAGIGPSDPTRYDNRTLGSAAVECALVASGGLQATMFAAVQPWDVAAGMVLAGAAGREVWVRQRARWARFASFPMSSEAALTSWKRTVLIGAPQAARVLR